MTIELRVPISPTPSFINQVLLQAASLRRFHPGSIIRVYVGHAEPTPEMRALVEQGFAGHRIGFEWVTGKEFSQYEGTRAPYLATMNKRWQRATGDVILITDADLIFTGTLDDILCRDAVQGVQAHVPPLSNDQFRYLFRICDAPEPTIHYPYTGRGFMAAPDAIGPFYPNSGMVVLPKSSFEAMVPAYHFAVNRIRLAMSDIYWADQLALSVAAAKADVPCGSLSVRFNFPNQREFEQKYPEDAADIRAVHYMRQDRINRVTDFESLAALRRLVNRDDLTGSHKVLQSAIAANLGILEPKPLDRAEDAPWA